jgi:hypothetical protein
MKYSVLHSFFWLIALSQISISNAQPNKDEAKSWLDTDGQRINAHGAGILFYQGRYYLYGEIKKGKTWLVPGQNWEDYRVAAGGISCYSSADLKTWKNEGVALAPVAGDPSNDLDTGRVIERPKVIFNRQTRKFVMWMHIDTRDYSYSRSGVAVSDHPSGPFRYINSLRPNGNMSRDMTLFQDDDGKAYLLYSSENNNTMHVCLLSLDYLSPTSRETRILIDRRREAPAMFKNRNKYYLISSGCTGWSANPATFSVADHPLGPWTEKGNPCLGPDGDSSFHSQSTFVLPIPGKRDSYLFMADRWNKEDLQDSRYLWLPLLVKEGQVKIE